MTFVPAVPFGGQAGWAFLQRTRPAQQAAFEQGGRIARLSETFAARIGEVTSAADLMRDRDLREVALKAFGLGDDIDSRHFVEKVLTSDLSDPRSLARRLSDKRYLGLAQAFGFGPGDGPRTAEPGFARGIIDGFHERGFEEAVGQTDASMRLVLGLERELDALAGQEMTDAARWYSVMAAAPLREVFQTALGLPDSFAALDLDRQLADFRDRAQATFGTESVADFADPEMRQKLIDRFLARDQAQAALAAGPGSGVRGAVALALLSG